MPISFSDLGLFADIVGAILLYFFGISPQLNRDGSVMLSAGTSRTEKIKARRYDLFARLGMGLVFFGFILQWIGDHNTEPVANVSLLAIALVATSVFVLVVLLLVTRRLIKARVALVAQYVPQFRQDQASFNRDHLWQFEATNHTRKRLQDVDLCFSREVTQVDILRPGVGSESKTKLQTVALGALGPDEKVIIRVWNLGSGPGSAEDVYLAIGKKVIRPRLLPSLDF